MLMMEGMGGQTTTAVQNFYICKEDVYFIGIPVCHLSGASQGAPRLACHLVPLRQAEEGGRDPV